MSYLTINGFSKLSKQQIFDTSVAHVLKNGRPSMEGRVCKYGGIGCGMAPFLKEGKADVADSAQDRYGASGWNELAARNRVPQKHKSFAVELQEAHDNAGLKATEEQTDFRTDYRARVYALALKHRLNTSVLDNML
jgi:hypothetical protein